MKLLFTQVYMLLMSVIQYLCCIVLPPPWHRLCSPVGVFLCAGLLQKLWADFIKTLCSDWPYQSEELTSFWWWSGPGDRFWITYSLPSPLQNRDFRFISISHTVTGRSTRHLAKWLVLTSGSESGFVSWIIFCPDFMPCWRFALSECSLDYFLPTLAHGK